MSSTAVRRAVPLLAAVAVVAVLAGAAYLSRDSRGPSSAVPAGGGSQPGSDGGGSAGSSGSPGTPAPTGSPVAPSAQPSTVTSRFETVADVSGGSALAVSFYGGVDTCYRYEVVAEETARQVALRLVETRVGEVCIDLAQHYERQVPLERPLGERVVVDATTGLPLHPVRAAEG